MPRKSNKAKVIDDIYYDAAARLLLLDSSDDSEEDDTIHDELQKNLNQVDVPDVGSLVAGPSS
jgi:hypothetical protein